MLINYLQRVLDLVGEVLERADGDALLGRVLRRAVRLGHVGDHHLWEEDICKIGVDVVG